MFSEFGTTTINQNAAREQNIDHLAFVESVSNLNMSVVVFFQSLGVKEQEEVARQRAAGNRLHSCNFLVR